MIARLANFDNEPEVQEYFVKRKIAKPSLGDLVFVVEDHGIIAGVVMARRNWYIHDLAVKNVIAAEAVVNYAIATGAMIARTERCSTSAMFICDPKNEAAIEFMERCDAERDSPGVTFFMELR